MNLNSAIAKDDFPAPVLPTIATFSPSSTLNEIPFSTGSRFGLKKLNSIEKYTFPVKDVVM